jgi:hypothetical protein
LTLLVEGAQLGLGFLEGAPRLGEIRLDLEAA